MFVACVLSVSNRVAAVVVTAGVVVGMGISGNATIDNSYRCMYVYYRYNI